MNASGIGAQLRSARLSRKLSIADISNQTKIASRFLESIEQGRLEELPGILFARNFVRQYASVVALDPEPLLARLPRLDDAIRQLPAAPRTPARRRGPWSRNRNWSGKSNSASFVVWLLLAMGAGFAAWSHYIHNPRNLHRPLVSATSPRPAAHAETEGASAAPAAKAETADSVTASASPATHPVEVVVTAVQSAWVQLIADGKTAFTGTLQPNETRQVSADEKVKIVAGNAGGLSVSLNGRKLDSLGPLGQVRVITLTAAGPQPPQASAQPRTAPDRL